MECPGTETFHLLVAGQLAAAERGRVADHAATCPACHAVIDALVTQHGEGPSPHNGTLAIGSLISGKYRIDQILGAGGMGFVVAATHLELRNRVAIKLMRDEMLASPATVERFIREARAVVKLRTEHVCKVIDVARLDRGAPYIVMELLEGVDLARAIAQRPLAVTIAVEYVLQACVALAEAHAAGIVHRDLKPANLFVTRRFDGGPLVKVLDFGIAKAFYESDASLTRTRVMMGSPGYMSPEQLESARDVDARSDLWALGVTLYQLLSGRVPFAASNATERAIQIAAEPPAPIDVEPQLRAVIFRCLEKAPDRRYPDAVELARALAPFGGPAAAQLVRAVAMSAHRSIEPHPHPGALPAGGMPRPSITRSTPGLIPTTPLPLAVGTVATELPRDAAPRPVAGRRWGLVTVVLAIALAAAGLVALVRRGDRTTVAEATTVVAPDAALGSPDAAIDAPVEPADAPSASASEPRASDKRKDRTPAKQVSFAEALAEGNRQLRAMCVEMVKPKNADTAMPVMLAMCWCRLGDAAQARAAYAKLTTDSRNSIRSMCTTNGVSLP